MSAKSFTVFICGYSISYAFSMDCWCSNNNGNRELVRKALLSLSAVEAQQ